MKRSLLIIIIPLLLMAFRTGGYRTGATASGTQTINIETAGADTLLYLKHYGSRTTDYGIVIDMDTSANTAANVRGIDMSGSNAINNSSDYYFYGGSGLYWRGDGTLRTSVFSAVTQLSAPRIAAGSGADFEIERSANYDITLFWSATKKGDIIFRDGNLGVANADFFQIQDSASNVVAQISNTGDITSFGDSINHYSSLCSTWMYHKYNPDSSIIEANVPMRFGTGSIIVSGDSVWINGLRFENIAGSLYVDGENMQGEDENGGAGFWERIGTQLDPKTPGDDVCLGTGKLLFDDAEIYHENVVHDPIYLSGQTGLNDLTFSGTYTLTGNAVFQVKIQATGTPDYFEWRKGNSGTFSAPIAMTGSAQLMQDGISANWGATTGHTLDNEWEGNVGHEVHSSEALHVLDDITTDGDLVIKGALRSLSPVRIAGGVELLCDAEISTDCSTMDFEIGGATRFTLEDDGTIAANTANYEALVTSDNDIPNKKYVDNCVINKTTGWLWGGEVTINVGDNTKVDISAGAVQIVTGTNNPVAKIITWADQIALDPALATRSTWIGVKDDGAGNAEFVYDTEFDAIERRSTAILVRIWDSGGSGPQITNVGDYERPAWGLRTAFQDFILEYGSWNISGNIYSANGTNLLLNKSAGKSFRYHAEDATGQENVHTDAAQSPRNSYAYHLQGSNVTTTETDIDPDYYDNSGVKTALANNKWTVQEVWFFPVSGTCHLLYGQIVYNSKTEAIDGITTETKVRNTGILDGAILKAYLILEKGCTDLTNSSTAEIREAKAGVGGGGSGSLWTKSGSNISLTTAGDDVLLNAGETFSITDMTTGSISFFGASGLLSQDNTNLFWDDTNNRLGIGTINPDAIFHIKANTPGTVGSDPAGQLIIQSPGTSVWSNAVITGYNSDVLGEPNQQLWYLGSSSSSNSDIILLNRSNSKLHFGTNSATQMTFDGSGNVGIGVTNPDTKLEVNGYTMLGSDAPAIKTKKLIGTTGATEGSQTLIAHGLTLTKILSASVLVYDGGSNSFPPGLKDMSELEYYMYLNTTNIIVDLSATNSGSLLSKAITVLVTYE